MKRLLSTVKRRGSQDSRRTDTVNGDSPEARVTRDVKLFCESGGPNNSGEEVLHLPGIVEAAESSPPAAREAANQVRRFLTKDNFSRPFVQYNAIMLVRILADNPGKSFTRNLDTKFAVTVKELLRECGDPSVQQILRETLETFETQKANDETLAPLREMWKKEKAKTEKNGAAIQRPVLPVPTGPVYNVNQQNYFARSHKVHGLPPPDELAQRIEEAKTSSKLLLQVVQSTPPGELQGNELIKEFVQRCQSASTSVQGYIHSTSPPPDEDTLLTLIETNDQLSTALSRHQRALLQAVRVTGANSISPAPPGGGGRGGVTLFDPPPPNVVSSPSSRTPQFSSPYAAPPGPPPGRQLQYQNPFDDHNTTELQERSQQQAPLALHPYDYGLPPDTTRPNAYQAPSSGGSAYPIQHMGNGLVSPLDAPSPLEENNRKPVQYRF